MTVAGGWSEAQRSPQASSASWWLRGWCRPPVRPRSSPRRWPATGRHPGGAACRVGAAPVAAAGNLLFAAGLLRRVVAVSVTPHYLTDLLPSMLLTGMGVGLTLPTLISASATALPPARFGTGSALVNMGRQVASALGVALFVTILGAPATSADAVVAFRHMWLCIAAASVLAAVTAAFVRRPPSAPGAGRSRPPGQPVAVRRTLKLPGDVLRLREDHRRRPGSAMNWRG
jgi:MFS family permease